MFELVEIVGIIRIFGMNWTGFNGVFVIFLIFMYTSFMLHSRGFKINGPRIIYKPIVKGCMDITIKKGITTSKESEICF